MQQRKINYTAGGGQQLILHRDLHITCTIETDKVELTSVVSVKHVTCKSRCKDNFAPPPKFDAY